MDRLVRNWWMMGVRGVLALAFGTTVLAWPGLDFGELVVLFAWYAIVDGVWTLAAALRVSGAALDSWPVALEGLVSLILGGLALGWPFVPAPDIRVLAFWGLVTGVVELAVAVRLPRDHAAHWFFGTAGVSSLFLAIYLYVLPRAVNTSVARGLGVYALVFGVAVLLTAACFRIEPRRAGSGGAVGADTGRRLP
ncbi:MAG TPA: DUF308 domain-containing protein [Methylomirabilota bacterium]|nr:DUF308 domain-containing protein [Methylomirabilota bacterium]